jgi:hypothetical protein
LQEYHYRDNISKNGPLDFSVETIHNLPSLEGEGSILSNNSRKNPKNKE